MKRVGPELKMPDLKNVKVPGFLRDLYQDLVDRRLLPLVVLIVVAIAAVPFLLGESEENPAPSPSMPGSAGSARASSLTVVEAQPGLRDYRRRLSRRSPTDPFEQHYTGAPANADLPEESTSSTSSEEPSVTTPSDSGSTESTPESSPPSGDVPPGELRLFAFAADVKIISTRTTADGKKEKGEPEVRREVVPPAALPSAKTQVVTFMGISPKTGKPLFLVSDDVEAIFGEPKCLSGSESCQLLEVDLQMPTTFVYEPTGTRYKINVLKIEPVLKGRYKG